MAASALEASSGRQRKLIVNCPLPHAGVQELEPTAVTSLCRRFTVRTSRDDSPLVPVGGHHAASADHRRHLGKGQFRHLAGRKAGKGPAQASEHIFRAEIADHGHHHVLRDVHPAVVGHHVLAAQAGQRLGQADDRHRRRVRAEKVPRVQVPHLPTGVVPTHLQLALHHAVLAAEVSLGDLRARQPVGHQVDTLASLGGRGGDVVAGVVKGGVGVGLPPDAVHARRAPRGPARRPAAGLAVFGALGHQVLAEMADAAAEVFPLVQPAGADIGLHAHHRQVVILGHDDGQAVRQSGHRHPVPGYRAGRDTQGLRPDRVPLRHGHTTGQQRRHDPTSERCEPPHAHLHLPGNVPHRTDYCGWRADSNS